ncbi:N-acetylglutaminylglutamine synthetase [Chenggangzhangella methanolivorans]|uniref:N-acetylglutaminylglutamine synthetase n=1 Tax=Chenggangzhangella methanolivorans TaxID=1437009 RepID=A0A9E6RIX5_9HYPH|nr:N-acetylglutaminylglutamine synthetase [Chenggangzhangella methanolivorans]QZO02316.1 N-acetylglutaminylglutamine synthetase [Chenggangzhangella methanolivorans]
MRPDVTVDCGWGRLLFAQTFADPKVLAEALREEGPDQRDIACYVNDPHVLIAQAPLELFLDPSHMFRLDLGAYEPSDRDNRAVHVRRLSDAQDIEAISRIYSARHMVSARPDFYERHRDDDTLVHLVAQDVRTHEIVGVVTGVDHVLAFDDTEKGSSLWCLAVDPQSRHPGVGEMLVRSLAELFKERGAAFMDLSVMHDNELAIGLYEKLGFERRYTFSIKRRNYINERLFVGEPGVDGLNPYAKIIVDEARRRGIGVEVTDAEGGFFRLTHGGRSLVCRESLSELTTGIAMSICDDKAVTRRAVAKAGVVAPDQIEAGDREALEAFLEKHGAVVVKPARGEQGRGITVGLDTIEDLEAAIEDAKAFCDRVVVEQMVEGEDLRIIVIDFKLVAAAIRRPAHVIGDGKTTIRELIEKQSKRRQAATGGESSIPMDGQTEKCVAKAGYAMDDVAPENKVIMVRKTANLHTGGTIHDVTGEVHPALVEAAVKCARAIDIPVCGIDFMVTSPRGPDYAFIECNERPGLANHEPQPTAERFIDLLFPLSMPAAVRRVGLG